MLKSIGKIGVAVAGLACLAPVILALFGVAGWGRLPAYIDYILVLALVLSLGIIAYTQQPDEQKAHPKE